MMRNSAWPVRPTAPAALLLLVASSGQAIGTAASAAAAERQAAHKDSDVRPAPTEAAVMAAFGLSEAGDVEALALLRDGIADPGERAVVDVRLAASQLDLHRAREAMRSAMAHPVQPKWLALALASEAGAAFATGDYGLCARDSAAWLQLPAGTDPVHGRADIAQMLAIAEQLAGLPGQRTTSSRPAPSPTWRDKATLVRTSVDLNGMRQEVVLDTGANLSVVSESTASKLGFEVIQGGSVRSSSRAAVPVRLAVARRLDIAGTTLTNVAFLVLRDADLQLPLPGGYVIPAIIGFPVLRALGRVTFSEGALTTTSSHPRENAGAKLVASGSDLFVESRVNGIRVPLHLDSGASRTTLGGRFAFANPALIKGLQTHTARSAGAGGASEETTYVLKDAVVVVGDESSHLSAVDVSAPTAGSGGNFGAIGQDVLRSSGGYTIDFGRMRLIMETSGGGQAAR